MHFMLDLLEVAHCVVGGVVHFSQNGGLESVERATRFEDKPIQRAHLLLFVYPFVPKARFVSIKF